jgi:PIN domain nuclease of toxin-antitoxin system
LISPLLDTCAAIWIAAGDELTPAATSALDDTADEGRHILVSPITAWEIGLLAAKGRVAIPLSPQAWFDRLMEAPSFHLAQLPPDVLIASSFLPAARFRDPADRILIATARAFGLTLITRDSVILGYAAAGHLQAIRC